MGWFSDLFDAGLPNEEQIAEHRMQIEELRGMIGIGGSFEYLGRPCVVTGHSSLIPTYPSLTVIPRLCFQYADADGVIRDAALDYEVAKATLSNKGNA